MAILKPDSVRLIAQGVDHSESICAGPDGLLYAGGEAGQIYRIDSNGTATVIANTGGFILGIIFGPDGCLYACDSAKRIVYRVKLSGEVTALSGGSATRPFTLPNHGVFDKAGNLYISDSGDYWDVAGTGSIFVIRPDGKTELFHHGPLRFPNGLALHADGRTLFIAQSTASDIVSIDLESPVSRARITHRLPPGTVPDGIAFDPAGRLLIGAYKPDAVFLGGADGSVRVLLEDYTGELLNRPTNLLMREGTLYVSNLGGWHITAVPNAYAVAGID